MYEWQHYLCAMFSDEESHPSMEVNELYVHAALWFRLFTLKHIPEQWSVGYSVCFPHMVLICHITNHPGLPNTNK